MTLTLVGLCAFGFLLGSIPFGFLIAKAKGVDIRTVGSGNIGATNVKRALGSRLAMVVFALDVVKGLAPTVVARLMIPSLNSAIVPEWAWLAVGACAFLGHIFSPWLGFKGGKGIATGLGMILGTTPLVAGIAFAAFLVVFIPTQYVSLGSLIATASLPLVVGLLPGQPHQLAPIYLILGLFIFWKHRENIRRLRAGVESKTSFRRSTPEIETSETSHHQG